ncbi:hypothetical protein DL96DRAFT_1633646 [Flagelloscypha sp. PMI_526]|nr:hypothetical protein DL96DRAFT_1633646 [Flagelloscypha sp. PMI_526]
MALRLQPVNLPLTAGQCGSALAADACKGQLDVVKFLINEGSAHVNLVLRVGNFDCALAAAEHGGQHEVARFLVEKGANVNLRLLGQYLAAV